MDMQALKMRQRLLAPLTYLARKAVARDVLARLQSQIAEMATESEKKMKYLALSNLVSRDLPLDTPLALCEASVFSQSGEDGVLFELCRRLPALRHSFVEFGIQTGQEGNCVLLADAFGWEGLFIEQDPVSFSELSSKYLGERITTLNEEVTPDNVEALFSSAGVASDVGILSIDIDGNDYWVWRAIGDYLPSIVVIEYNGKLPFDDLLVQPYSSTGWSGSRFFGASLGALEALGTAKGYHLIHTDLSGVNAFFVRDDLIHSASSGGVVKHAANYFLAGREHPPDMLGRTYVHPPPFGDGQLRR